MSPQTVCVKLASSCSPVLIFLVFTMDVRAETSTVPEKDTTYMCTYVIVCHY